MIRVNFPLQATVGIFVHDEIIQMHTIHESNYTVMKQPCNGNSKAKKITKTVEVRSYKAQLMGWMHMTMFTPIIHL